jgi:hypothetical protein
MYVVPVRHDPVTVAAWPPQFTELPPPTNIDVSDNPVTTPELVDTVPVIGNPVLEPLSDPSEYQ